MPEWKIWAIFMKICWCVNEFNWMNRVHLELNPYNTLIDENFNVFLTDNI